MMRDTAAECIAAQMGVAPVTPQSVVVGMGAEKGVPAAEFEAAMRDILHDFGLTPENVRAVATLDRRAAEEGFRVGVTQRGWPLLASTAEQLATIRVTPNPSAVVTQAIDISGVCEPAAMLA